MVLREKKINNKSDEVKLSCSFSLVDVKAFFKIYAKLCKNIKDLPQSEQDFRYWLEHDGRAFLSWPQKWREQLRGWAFAVAVRNKLLIPSASRENRYYLADCLFVNRGRPKNKEE